MSTRENRIAHADNPAVGPNLETAVRAGSRKFAAEGTSNRGNCHGDILGWIAGLLQADMPVPSVQVSLTGSDDVRRTGGVIQFVERQGSLRYRDVDRTRVLVPTAGRAGKEIVGLHNHFDCGLRLCGVLKGGWSRRIGGLA